jgi:hypothetical protein
MAVMLETTNSLRFPVRSRVSYRSAWTAEWTEAEDVYLDSLSLVANPQISGAACSMRYGWIRQPDEIPAAEVEALDLLNKFVRVEIYESLSGEIDRTWVGVCRGQVDVDEGVHKLTKRNQFGVVEYEYPATGVRQYTVLGIESLLDNQVVLESGCEKPTETGWWLVHRGLTFNEPHQRGKAASEATTGNRSTSKTEVRTGREVYLFPKNLDAAARWTSLDIAEYLLALFSPASEDGAARVNFVLNYSFDFALVWYETPILASEGRTVWSLLNQLFDRRRGIAFRVDYNTDTNNIELVLFTFNPSAITSGDDELPANPTATDLDLDDAADIEGLTINSEALAYVNQVVVRGARAVTVCTVSEADQTSTNYWAEADQTAYATAGEDEPDFATLDEDEQELVRQEARATERFAKVYRDYGLPVAWDGLVGDGEGGDTNPYFPDVYGNEAADTLNYWIAGLRYEPQLPLRTNSDYADDAIETGVVNTTATNQPWEYRPILACAKTSVQLLPQEIQDDLGNSDFDYDGRWLNLIEWDKNPALEFAPNLYAVTPRPLQDAPGLSLRVQGAPQFVMGGSGVSDLLEYYCLARIDPSYLTATVAFEVDGWCEGKYPLSVSGGAIVERLVINAGERAKLIYVAPGTVVDLKDGALVRSEGGYLRDDRPKLEALARFAYRWYATPRKSVSFTINRILLQPEIAIGQMITRVGGGGPAPGGPFRWITINTPITSISYEFPEGAGPRPPFQRTRVATDFAALDFTSFYRD